MRKNNIVLRNNKYISCAEHIVLILIIALTFYSLQPIDVGIKKIEKISIHKNMTAKSIITQLSKRGYKISIIDQLILSIMHPLREGEVRIGSKHLSRIDFLYRITMGNVPLSKITLIPGETLEIFSQQIAKKLDINATKILDNYYAYSKYPEAGIAADTYFVPKKINEKKLIHFLLQSSEKMYKKLSESKYQEYDITQWHKILTIASIIQKEAANNKEMPLIASVIYNRLAKNMRLQMDGTLNYGKYSHVKVTPKRIKTDTSTFNTYKHKGLPISPIASVSVAAIKAALFPATTNYLYFMRNKQGTHDFTDTFKKHRKNIKKTQ